MKMFSCTGMFSTDTRYFSKKKSQKKKKNSVGKRLRDMARKAERWIARHPNLTSTALNLANLGINAKLAFGGYKVKHE